MPYDVDGLRRAEFPWAAAGEAVYLDAAGTGPLPERTLRAQAEFTRKRAAPFRLSHEEQFAVLDAARDRAAALIGAEEGSVALAANTGAGLNLAAWGLPLGEGDAVVVPDLEFPANIYPWMAASRSRGFTLRRVPARDGLLDEEAVLAALDGPAVRVLALSWVGFATGVVADLDRLAAECDARGIWLVVDGIQGVGVLPLDVRRTSIALLACGAQKWLLSPWGSGFTYVRPDVVGIIDPQPVSWMAVRGSDDFSTLVDYRLEWRDGARRFEQITVPFQDFAGMAASVGLLLELGVGEIARHVASLTGALAEGAARLGVPVVTPAPRAGIVTLRPEDAGGVSALLRDAGVSHSVREGTIRLAPHCYSTSGEIAAVIDVLASARGS
ncbi:MAG TPA: aminotransferase class V-fold PLP-dependent enzyme [Gemmatimonadaceae bacterium]|nr:aminotransferase class V-fold PLP-dependent enzyme [Gemmatimonadaceae bacterium]